MLRFRAMVWALLGIHSAFGQNFDAQYKANLQNSWVKQVPFEALPSVSGTGKVIQVSKNPHNPFEMYVAVASSGVWYSNNNGNSFSPIFSSELPSDVSAMGIHWQSKSVWVTTSQGIFYTQDNGTKWHQTASLRLKNATNFVFISPSEVFVSAMGDEASSEKGVFRTTDQGKTWEQVFGQVGVTQLIQTPNQPETLFLVAWDREISSSEMIVSGKKSGIYKSTDKGNTWTLLTGNNSGFLQHNVGKIALAIHSQNTIYALVDNRNAFFQKKSSETIFETLSSEDFLELEDQKLAIYIASHNLSEKYAPENLKEMVRSRATTPAGLAKYIGAEAQVVGAEIYLSTNGGTSWVKQNEAPLENVFYNRGYAVASLSTNPKNEKELYLSGVPLLHSTDGGKNWNLLKDNPLDTEVFQLSVDERQMVYVTNYGFFQSFDSGKTWATQSLPQSVKINTLSVGNPSDKTLYASAENAGVWRFSAGAWQQISSENGSFVMDSNGKYYIIKPFGSVLSWENGQWRKSVPPYAKDSKQRFAKNAPLIISPQNPSILYTGSNQLFQSLNQGKHWNTISNNLTNGDKSGNLPYGTISAIAESPFQFGLLYTGSDDGMIYTSQNGGVSWQMVYSSFPQPNSVACLVASKHQKERIYAVLRNQNEKQALLFRSENAGKTWENIKANLPNENVNTLLEDDANEQLLYIGTENGIYVSFDRGEKWHIFQRNIPRTQVHSLVLNPQTNVLYAGTSRGVFSANIAPLRELRAAVRDQIFYPLKETYFMPFSTKWGNKTNAWEASLKPMLHFEAFASGTHLVKMKIMKDGIVLNAVEFQTDYGFNYFPYDLTLTEEARLAHEKQKQRVLYKKASDGKYYLPRGIYQLVFEGDLILEERFLEVK